MRVTNLWAHINFRSLVLFVYCGLVFTSSLAQTTFTESAAVYGLNIGGNKDGGHGWADYDLDGDYDVFINANSRGYLLRNNGGSFTDVTNTLISDVNNDGLERSVLFVDFNNDGYPDIFRNDSGNARIYLQIPNETPANIRFGLSNGTQPNQTFNGGNIANGFNSEGAGALDFDGDGDLDIFIDNHNFGIDILENDGNGFFTHVTAKPPGYDVNDASTWPLGLVQDATDGDYGSATDFNDDGWVDIVARKQDQVDLFTNIGGTFQDGVNIDQASNGNKGAVGFYDFDNDGDFDLFWTENGTNQIHRNNGDGTWTGLGAATGIPTGFSGQIEGLACGDVDNDGDIDIFLANGSNGNSHRSRLYLNQINNGGGPMSFINSGLTFGNRSEGSTFIDVDTDGDLDLYVNRNNRNQLYINNLNATDRANHLFIDVIEDRDAFGLINTEQRFGVGATAKILDCDGNVISGTREVNGGSGHGTMEAGVIHFGLPEGPNTPIVVEVAYPRTSSGRVVVRSQITPSNFFNGNVNLVEVLPDITNLPPEAQDDLISTSAGNDVNFDAIIDNGNGVDTDPESATLEVISLTQPANGTAVLNFDGTITYSPGGFIGTTTFTYTIGDNPICSFASGQDTATVFITVSAIPDNDNDGISDDVDLDDDNDGIYDAVENSCGPSVSGFDGYWPLDNDTDDASGNGHNLQNGSVTYSNESTRGSATASFNGTSNNMRYSDGSYLNQAITNFSYSFWVRPNTLSGTQILIEEGGTGNGIAIRLNGNILESAIREGGAGSQQNTSTFTFPNDGAWHHIALTYTNGTVVLYLDSTASTPLNTGFGQLSAHGSAQNFGRTDGGDAFGSSGSNFFSGLIDEIIHYPFSLTTGEVVNLFSYSCDADNDGTINSFDSDSDNEGCNDTDEAYGDVDADSDNNGMYGSGTPSVNSDGTVIGASYAIPADNDINSVYDFLEAGTAPTISLQPMNTIACPGCTATFSVTSTGNSFQWQLFDGFIWNDLIDTGIYSGTSTNTLTVANTTLAENGNQYRVNVSNPDYICSILTSNTAILNVQVATLITNRRITYRVNKN